MQKTRPKHLDLTKIRQPIPAVVSILHRISGVLMFVSIPFLLYVLHGSLSSAETFEAYKAVVTHPLAKLLLLALIWAYCHHALAGIRFLFMDIHVGDDLPRARLSAKLVLAVSLVLTAVMGVMLW